MFFSKIIDGRFYLLRNRYARISNVGIYTDIHIFLKASIQGKINECFS